MRSHYDAIVVGSGPAGSAFARTFVESAPGATVLLVEVGPRLGEPAGRHVRNIGDPTERSVAQSASEGPRSDSPPVVPPDGHTVRPGTFLVGGTMTAAGSSGMPGAAMSSNVGGMGAHWTAACPPPGGAERIPFIPEAEMDSVLNDAAALLGVTQEAFAGAALAAEVIDALAAEFPRADDDRPVQPMPLAVRVGEDGVLIWAGTDGILGPVLESGAVELRAETLVTRVEIEDGRVNGVRLRPVGGDEDEFVAAPLVFVAADSLRTPQLLHASHVRPWALGRFLNDHADARTFVQLDDRFRDLPGRGGVAWIPYSDDDGFPFHCQVMQLDASPIGFVAAGEEWPGSTVGVVVFGTRDLRPEDRVEFSEDERDAYGMPALRISYDFTDRDHEKEEELLAMASRIAAVLGTPLVPPRVLPAGASYHIMGSVRMGDDPATSVCDTDAAVWDVPGLYVGGNGVIPTPTACNPTVTSVALAIRSARAAAAATG